MIEHFQTIHIGHLDVQEYEIVVLPVHHIDSSPAAIGAVHVIARLLEPVKKDSRTIISSSTTRTFNFSGHTLPFFQNFAYQGRVE